jgi:hypothetical protein
LPQIECALERQRSAGPDSGLHSSRTVRGLVVQASAIENENTAKMHASENRK